jgi:hypothetical protein
MSSVRAELVRLMRATIRDRANWTYEATRPLVMPPRPWKRGQHVTADCSKGVQDLCWWAESPADPMGLDYGPFGNSQTLCAHLRHVAEPAQLEPGDIITFGRDGEDHAAMVLERGADPLLWSFGHQGAPNSYPLSADGREHQLLKLPVKDPPKTPEQKLRAMTGYWSWLQWRLGEGSWRKYEPCDKTVRPHVRRLVRLSWWRRYRRYLRNRNNGNTSTTSPKETP